MEVIMAYLTKTGSVQVDVRLPASSTPDFASSTLLLSFSAPIFSGSKSALQSWINANLTNFIQANRYVVYSARSSGSISEDKRSLVISNVWSDLAGTYAVNTLGADMATTKWATMSSLVRSVMTGTIDVFGQSSGWNSHVYLSTNLSPFYIDITTSGQASSTDIIRYKDSNVQVLSYSVLSLPYFGRAYITSGPFYGMAVIMPYINTDTGLIAISDYETYNDNGPYHIVIRNDDSDFASLRTIAEYLISPTIPISDGHIAVTLNPTSFIYDGTAKTPQVTVTYVDAALTPPAIRTLVEGRDYTKTYQNNINVGTASVIIAGAGEFSGSRTEHFTIGNGTPISSCTVVLNPTTFEHDGTPKEPSVVVTYQSTTLTRGIDYTVSFANNIDVGTADCIISGAGTYYGQRTEHFTITPVTIPITSNKIIVNMSQREFVYDGTAKTPTVTLAYIDQTLYPPVYRNLVRNQDYLLTYQNNINVGTASAVIVGRGDFSGTRTENFTIVDHSNNVNSFTFDYNEGPYQYTGEAITVGYIGAYDDLGNVMTMNTDFSVTYTNNIAVGTASIIVTGIGYYTGQRTLPFYIVQDIRNPYGNQFSGPSHSYGTFSPVNGPIPGHNVPTANASNSGLVTIFAPTLSQLQSLAGYLWTESSLFQTIWNHAKQIIENPLDSIITLQVLPVTIPSSATAEFKVLFIGTGVNMSLADSQFASLDCGYYDLKEFFGSSLDYTPYTKIQLFLPYVGYVDIDPDVFMGHRISVTYHYDITTGAFVAFVFRDTDVFLQFPGNFSTNFSRYISALSAMTNTAIGAVSGGLVGAAMGLMSGQFNQPPTQQTTPIQLPPSPPQAPLPMLPGGGGSIAPALNVANPFPQPPASPSSPASFAGLSTKPNINLLSAVMATKRLVGSSGSFNGASGFLGTPYCYLIIERPNRCVPEDYAHLHGWPCMMTLTLGDLTGYTEVQQCDLVNCPATNPEQEEILSLLKSGVIL